MSDNSTELDGLQASLEKLVHHREKSKIKGLNLHAFIYFISIHNLSDRSVTLKGRKWVLSNDDGTTTVVEGEKIVGETPCINPGESFPITAIMLPTYPLPHPVLFTVQTNTGKRFMFAYLLFVWKFRKIRSFPKKTLFHEVHRPESTWWHRGKL